MTDTKISWTNKTWNPVTGCSKVSPGCAHCYAEQLSMRPFMRSHGYTGLPWTPEHAAENVKLHPERLEMPLKWRKPSMVFVNSMSDLFHELVPFEFIDKVFAVMALTPQHTYQVLTKRPERMREYCLSKTPEQTLWMDVYKDGHFQQVETTVQWPLPNVWLGTSVENQRWADERIPHLLQTPAAVRFLSCEPLLGPVDLWSPRYQWPDGGIGLGNAFAWGKGINWVIVGGESGPGFRKMDLQWARDIRDQCVAAGIPYFFKQQSHFRNEMHPHLDGLVWHQFPGELTPPYPYEEAA